MSPKVTDRFEVWKFRKEVCGLTGEKYLDFLAHYANLPEFTLKFTVKCYGMRTSDVSKKVQCDSVKKLAYELAVSSS